MEEIQFTGKFILKLTTETVEDGRVFERAYYRPGICIIPIINTPDGPKIRCIREQVRMTDEIRTKLVSGYIWDDENPLACAQREAREEIGLVAGNWSLWMVTGSEEGAVKKQQYYFVARDISSVKANPDPDEVIEGYFDYSYPEIEKMISDGVFGNTSTAFVLLCFVTGLKEKWCRK